jgi:3,4-dihydroxy 2-butanone 4-phosphate synthase/GTP cyclohydrolase II
MARFAEAGRGVLVYLRDGTAGVPTSSLSESQNRDETRSEARRENQWREVGLGAQILRDLGVRSIINLSSSAKSFVGLSGFGIELITQEKL